MRTASIEQLKRQVAIGAYGVDAGALAGRILSDFALVRRVGRELSRDESADERGPGGSGVTRRRGADAKRLSQRRDVPRQ